MPLFWGYLLFHIICVCIWSRGDVIKGQDHVLARGHPKSPVSSDN